MRSQFFDARTVSAPSIPFLLLALLALSVPAPLHAGGTPDDVDERFSAVREVVVHADDLDLTIEAVAGNDARLTVRNLDRGRRVEYRIARGQLTVVVSGRPTWPLSSRQSPEVRLQVPAAVEIDARTTSGDVTLSDTAGALTIATGSGNVSLRDVGGDIAIGTGSGDVAVDGVAGRLSIETGSGEIDLEDLRGVLAVESSSGDITGTGILLTADARIVSSSGSIAIDVAHPLADLSLNLSTSSGEIRVDGHAVGTSYRTDGGRWTVTGRTSSGDQRWE